jgi:hypothetical protein
MPIDKCWLFDVAGSVSVSWSSPYDGTEGEEDEKHCPLSDRIAGNHRECCSFGLVMKRCLDECSMFACKSHSDALIYIVWSYRKKIM